MSVRLRIGTRGSALARAQAEWFERRMRELHPGLGTELVFIRTSGDRFLNASLSAIGGKGLFVKEIEEALCRREIDCAVHSLKDLPLELAPGLRIAAVPVREDPYDVAVTRAAGGLGSLAAGARIGTSSLRRTALVRALHAGLEVVPLRGNVDTRLRKLESGEIDAVVLAAAGLKRLGLRTAHVERCDAAHFVPAIGQGALAIECRDDDTVGLVAALDDADSRDAVEAERALLGAVAGSCVTPIAAHASVAGERISLRGLIAEPDGSRVVRGTVAGDRALARELGERLGAHLLADGGAEILDRLRRAG